jgi:hypothetical protein
MTALGDTKIKRYNSLLDRTTYIIYNHTYIYTYIARHIQSVDRCTMGSHRFMACSEIRWMGFSPNIQPLKEGLTYGRKRRLLERNSQSFNIEPNGKPHAMKLQMRMDMTLFMELGLAHWCSHALSPHVIDSIGLIQWKTHRKLWFLPSKSIPLDGHGAQAQ